MRMKSKNSKTTGNIAELLYGQIRKYPRRVALRIPLEWNDTAVTRYESMTFGDMGKRIAAYRGGLTKAGFRAGDRVIIMIPPCVELYCIAMALLASGMVPVMADPGMGFGNMLTAFDDSKARAIISIAKFCRLRYLVPRLWKYRCYSVDGGGPGIRPASLLLDEGAEEAAVYPCGGDYHGIITFTSGSTGRPKGADRTHGSLVSQHRAIRKSWPDTPRDIDMTCFPVVVLHNLSCGMPSVLAATDYNSVASVNPAVILSQIEEFRPTRLSSAPAFMGSVADYIIGQGRPAASLRSVAVGGAPVPDTLCRKLRQAFPRADARVVYGSTEAEPISSVPVEEVLESEGSGFLVGKPYPFTEVKIVSLPGDPGSITDKTLGPYAVKAGEIGEIIVSGDHVLKGYVENPEADRENKIPRDSGVWHRTGDTGYFDRRGRIWLTGRSRDAVRHNGRIIQPYLLERQADAVAGVSRSALVGLDGRGPVLAVVLGKTADPRAVLNALHEKLMSAGFADITVRTVPRIPVDRRHNSKIDRIALAKELS
jgi:olefin beta-lactone synthetase